MFIITRQGEAVGYSSWPWDRLYAPVVGCFLNGHLQSFAVCDLEPQQVGLNGPTLRSWFRLKLERSSAQGLLDGDPSIRIVRLEDGAGVEPAVSPEFRAREGSIEALMAAAGAVRSAPLSGFPAFLTAPLTYQLDILFLDLLRRLPDPSARADYLDRLLAGEQSILQLRDTVLGSDEFRERGITAWEGVGSLMTASIWSSLVAYEALGEHFAPLQSFRVRDYDDLSTPEFVTLIYEMFLERSADPVGLVHYGHVADTAGRAKVASDMSREAAHLGLFINVMEA